MKPIKIDPKNHALIEAALAAVNGKATQHTYGHAYEIDRVVQDLEKRLDFAEIPKKDRPGCSGFAVSGGTVPSAYKYTRKGTFVSFERKTTGWFLIGVKAEDVYKEGGCVCLALTDAQKAKATEKYLKRLHGG